jgi:MATE family multidrug resistance protein
MFLDVSAFSVMGFVLARLGAVEMAAHQISLQISQLTVLPILAIGEASSVLAGQAAGAKQLNRIPVILRMGIACGVLFATCTGVVLLQFSREIAACFTGDGAVQRLAVIVLYVAAGFPLAFALYAMGKCMLRALGDIRFTVTTTAMAAWLCSPPLAYVFGHWLGWGVVGGWCALASEIVVASSIYLARLESGAWKRGLARLELPEQVSPLAPDVEPLMNRI